MATIAEFYSRNLSSEAKKGMAEKARRGGTIGYAPVGYLNTTSRIDGREAKTVAFDPDRSDHIRWAFETYADGSLSLSELAVQLAARGLTSRDRRSLGKPLSRSQVHRILSNPYYTGQVVHQGATYAGNHEALVDEATFARVQDVLGGRRIAGDRAWKNQGLGKVGRLGV